MFRTSLAVIAAAVTLSAASISAQGGLSTSQPNYITIVREEVKLGHNADHQRIEAGWPAAYERAKSPDYYLAFVSLTGRPEAWFVQAFESHQAMGESMKREDADAVLSAELKRLSRADADAINNVTILQFRARKDLSIGAFPDLAKQRFTEITTFRVRPGHDAQFEAAARAYGGAAKRSAPATSFRVYQMMAGGPESTYMVFASVQSYAEFDKMMQEGEGVMKGATAAEREALEKFSNEGVIGVETQRFRVDPVMSYVPKDTRASDPAFWSPKKPAPATQTTSAQKPAVQQTAAKK